MMGFDYHAFRRMKQFQKAEFVVEKKLNFYWRGSNSLSDEESSLFTRAFYSTYGSPVNWEGSTKPVTEKTIKSIVDVVLENCELKRISAKNPKHILFLFGHDFTFITPDVQFGNMSLVIEYINKHSKFFRAQYSTISEYFDEVRKDVPEKTWPEWRDDFFVYNDKPLAYWSGYFVSFPSIKLAARKGERVLRKSEMLFSVSQLENSIKDNSEIFVKLDALRRRAAVFQHHDTITGTSKEHVRKSDLEEMGKAIKGGEEISDILLSSIVCNSRFVENGSFLTTQNIVGLKNGDVVPLTILNSLSWVTRSIAKIFIDNPNVVVYDPSQKIVRQQVKKIEGNMYELEFEVTNEAYGFVNYELHCKESRREINMVGENFSFQEKISNEKYDVFFNSKTLELEKVVNKKSNVEMKFNFYMGEYLSSEKDDQSSGCYIFRPKEFEGPEKLKVIQSKVVENDLSIEVHQTFSNYSKVIIRLYKTSNSYSEFIEFDFTSGVLPEDVEMVAIIESDVKNEGKIVYDQLGYESKEKKYEFDVLENVARNFYPTQYSSYIRDNTRYLSVLTEKSQAVSSRKNGMFESLIHRRTSKDDKRGVGEPLKDVDVINFKMRIIVDKNENSPLLRRHNSYLLNYPNEVFSTQKQFWNVEYPKDYMKRLNFVENIPSNVHLLSFDKMEEKEEEILVRFVHIFERNEDKDLSNPVEIEMKNIFNNYTFQSISKTSLTTLHDYGPSGSSFVVNPIQIKSFVVKVKK